MISPDRDASFLNGYQTPDADLERGALEHYQKLSHECCQWSSIIPMAIRFYFKYHKEIEARKKKKLPANLRSRIKILVRELGAFNGICYEEMNGLIHKLYYPKRDRVIAGQTIESSIPTNELTPDEARIIEQELYNLGATLGCPLSLPQAKG